MPALLPSHGPAELRAVAELRCRGISTPMAEFCAWSPRSGRAEGPGGACAASSKLCEARIGLAPALVETLEGGELTVKLWLARKIGTPAEGVKAA